MVSKRVEIKDRIIFDRINHLLNPVLYYLHRQLSKLTEWMHTYLNVTNQVKEIF